MKRLMLSLFIQGNYKLQNLILQLWQKILFSRHNRKRIQKILIWRGGSLGDNICALPAFAVIRQNFPKAQIDILTNSRDSHLVSLNELIASEIIDTVFNFFPFTLRQKWSLFQSLRTEQYDLFIEIPENLATLRVELRNMMIARFLGIPAAFGWQVASTKSFRKHQAQIIQFENETQRLLNLLKKNDLKIGSRTYPLGFTEKDFLHVKTQLSGKFLLEKEKNIALVIGAKRKANQWPLEYFAEVARYLIAKDLNIFLVGGKEDHALAKRLVFNRRIHNFCGQFTPLESGVLFQFCRLTLTNDTGPMHLSYAVGTPVIALFSARDYAQKWFPPRDGLNKVFRKDEIACSPCFLDDCPYDNLCLREIHPQQILKELHERGL